MSQLPADPGPHLIVSADGAARGNPGPAGIGAVVTTPRGRVLAEVAEGIGIATNNVAEYRAALAGLQRARDLGASRVTFRSDSRLLIEQLAGRYRVKNPTLQRLHGEVGDVLREIPEVDLVHVPRAENVHADRLANVGVDAWLAGAGRRWRRSRPNPTLFDPQPPDRP
ncbi:MAG TPA: ribonuclease HI family protein [Actinomycetota bacterium]|nr:ribonuclease HI family protein [Actinomycetota bacterium]